MSRLSVVCPVRLPPIGRHSFLRFEAPLEPLQVSTWVLLLVIVGGFYSFIVPTLPKVWAVIAGVVYGVLASATVLAAAAACWIDPIDPNVRRFHQVGSNLVDEFDVF